MTVAASNDIFRGHRALGLVCNTIPFVLKFQQNRKEYLIFTAVGRHFHAYGASIETLTMRLRWQPSSSPMKTELLGRNLLSCDVDEPGVIVRLPDSLDEKFRMSIFHLIIAISRVGHSIESTLHLATAQ